MCCIFTRLGIIVKLMLKRHAKSVPFIENFYLSKNIFLIEAIIAMIQNNRRLSNNLKTDSTLWEYYGEALPKKAAR